jgi:uncharacterized protein
LLDELSEVLHRKKLTKKVQATGSTAAEIVKLYRRLAYHVTARQFTKQISRDADDDAVLACALAAKAELIISGDRDLLTLKTFRNIPIMAPTEAMRNLGVK